jgi:hypothetical protein
VELEDKDGIDLAQDKESWQAFANAEMNDYNIEPTSAQYTSCLIVIKKQLRIIKNILCIYWLRAVNVCAMHGTQFQVGMNLRVS